jgi:HAD superfamily hydrolase (TIGR01509 family)
MKFRAVLFDWDGTLLDSSEACYRVYTRLFTEHGIPFDRDVYERTYSPNWERTYAWLGLPRERWEGADRRYLELWAGEEIPLRPGAQDLVHRFDRFGATLGLVTSGERVRVEPEVERHGLKICFDAVVCGDDIARKKPDPEGLHLALEQLQVRPCEAAYVGDSPEDVEMARDAGVFSVGIDGGFPNRGTLRASRPDVLAESLEHLREIAGLVE